MNLFRPQLVGLCLASLCCGLSLAQTDAAPATVPVMPDRGHAMVPLQTLVGQAIERSPAIREAQANWRAAEQEVAQSRGALWPRLEFSANSSGTKLEGGPATPMGGRLGAAVVYNVLDFGKTRDQIESRRFQALAFEHRVQTARETATFDTVSAYLQLVKHQRLIRIYEQHISELQMLVGKLTEIVAVFAGRRSELTQAQTRLGQARDALLAVKARQREFQLILIRQAGAIAVPESFPETLPSFPADGMGSLLDGASSQHAAVRAVRSEAASARAQVAELHAARKPQLDLQLSKQIGQDANGFASPTQLYLSARWVAFDGFGGRSGEQAMIEKAQAADEKAGQLLMEIEFNIQTAWADYQAQASRVRELSELLKGTDQVRKDYYDQWRELGRRSLLDVLTAESEYLNTNLSLATSEVDQVIALGRMRFEAGSLKAWLVGDEGQALTPELPPSRPTRAADAALSPVTAPVHALASSVPAQPDSTPPLTLTLTLSLSIPIESRKTEPVKAAQAEKNDAARVPVAVELPTHPGSDASSLLLVKPPAEPLGT